MPHAAENPSPRYRNDTVFRSAERLIASTPRKPSTGRASRPTLFLVGLLCGFGAAVLLFRYWQETSSPRTAPASPISIRPSGARKAPPIRSQAIAAAPEAASSETTKTTDAPAATRADLGTPYTPAPKSLRGASPLSARSTTSASQPAVSFGTSTSANLVKLRGEIRPAVGGSPVQVEFQLYFRAQAGRSFAAGTVEFLTGPDRGAPIRIEGALVERTLSLSQFTSLPRGGYNMPIIHSFVIEFPDPEEPADVMGKWTFGAREGSLVLKVVLTPQSANQPKP